MNDGAWFAAQKTTAPWFYPGSGETHGCNPDIFTKVKDANVDASVLTRHTPSQGTGVSDPPAATNHGTPSAITFQASPVPENLFECSIAKPNVVNVGMPAGLGPKYWRRIMTSDVLPRITEFKPDLILISAGFDAHHKDAINCGYVSLREDDYEWITLQLMKIANTTCQGRIVSVLEGGYKIQGRIVSAFGRSVASHVRALASGTQGLWSSDTEMVRNFQYKLMHHYARLHVI
jgi:hypothetical protein